MTASTSRPSPSASTACRWPLRRRSSPRAARASSVLIRRDPRPASCLVIAELGQDSQKSSEREKAFKARLDDAHEELRKAREEIEAYGSLAQAVIEAGVAGVVAMRYAVFAVTAAQFVAELYGALTRGQPLGEAATWARIVGAGSGEHRSARRC